MTKDKKNNVLIYANAINTDDYEQRLAEANPQEILEVNIVIEKDDEIKNLLWVEKSLKNIPNKQINILLYNGYSLNKEALNRIIQILKINNIGEYKEFGQNKTVLCCNMKNVEDYKTIERNNQNLVSENTINDFKDLLIRKKTSLQLLKQNNGESSKLNSRKKIIEVIINDTNCLTAEMLEILSQKSNIEINVSDKQNHSLPGKNEIDRYFGEYENNYKQEHLESVDNTIKTEPKNTLWSRFTRIFKKIRNIVKHEKSLALPEPK